MKTVIATVATVLGLAAVPAEAGHHGHGRGHHGHHGHHGNGHRTAELIIPVLIGGVIGYEIARQNSQIVVPQPQVIVTPPQRSQLPQPINVPGIECPAGTAPFWTVTHDYYNRPTYTISCR